MNTLKEILLQWFSKQDVDTIENKLIDTGSIIFETELPALDMIEQIQYLGGYSVDYDLVYDDTYNVSIAYR